MTLVRILIALFAAVLRMPAVPAATADEAIVGTDHWVQSASGADGKPLKIYVCGLFAMQHPDKVKRLVMYAPPLWTAPRGQAPTQDFRTVTPENARGLFEPPASDPAAVDTWVKEVGQWGPKAPNGVLLDLLTKMPLTDPSKITAATMIIFGDLDRLTPINQPNIPVFFAALPNTDKQLIIVPGAGHALTVQKPRLRFYSEVAKWFSVE
jgi:pimeloyl-ACP methyl ester carboxylesterase